MNLKLKAGFYTAGVVASVYIGLMAIKAFFEALPESLRSDVFLFFVIGLMLYGLYGIILSTLEFKEKMKKISDRK